jgi:hypothetical protein
MTIHFNEKTVEVAASAWIEAIEWSIGEVPRIYGLPMGIHLIPAKHGIKNHTLSAADIAHYWKKQSMAFRISIMNEYFWRENYGSPGHFIRNSGLPDLGTR